jgi:hypothetical protein
MGVESVVHKLPPDDEWNHTVLTLAVPLSRFTSRGHFGDIFFR